MKVKTILSITLVLTTLLTGCAAPKSVSIQVPEPDYWPTSGWRNSAAEAQGMDSDLLAQMLEDISANKTNIHSLLVIRNGYIVIEAYFHPYTRDTKMHIQSVTKSVIGMLVGKAITDGYLKDGNVKLSDFYDVNMFENPDKQKESIRLKHLLSMSSGLDCQEFSGIGPSMEQSDQWVHFVLDRPMVAEPGKIFGYCNGNAHLLSAIVEKSVGKSAREYANQSLFQPLGIPLVSETDWGSDPQKITIGGYGLHLTPSDMAKLALLYLQNGQWNGQQIIYADWVAESTTEHIQKEDGSGYGYLWTVYQEAGHYAALGLGGQQIHVYPSKNLIVVTTASLESYAEAPEIEKILNEYILPAVKSDCSLAENPDAYSRLQTEIKTAAYPVQPVQPISKTALDISHSIYRFDENPLGWETLEFVFEPESPTSQIILNGATMVVGLDNIFRMSNELPGGEILLRGRWVTDDVFILDYPYPLTSATTLGEMGVSEFRFKFTANKLDMTVQQLVFGGGPMVFEGIR
jgi:CubicO group peptidase (beta-lactamase class C family)